MLSLALIALVHAAPLPEVLNAPDGRIALAHGVLSAPYTKDLTDAALDYVLSRRRELGLGPSSTLSVKEGFSTRFGATVHLEQRIGGIAVYGATAIVTFDEQRRVVRVATTLRPEAPSPLVWTLSGPQALARASKEVNYVQLKWDGTPYGGYQPYIFFVEGHLRPGYLTWVPTLSMKENWHLAIDAGDGHVIFQQNRVYNATAAKVYASAPGGIGQGVGVAPLIDVDLVDFPASYDGGTLVGSHVTAWNCCPTAGCDTDAGAPAKRSVGMLQTFNGNVPYDVAICDRVQRANNDPAVNPNGNYIYAPVDPPTTQSPTIASLADWDAFAEVHAYHHVNKVYDYVHALSVGPFALQKGLTPLLMADERRGMTPSVWVNANDPDFQSATMVNGVYVSNTLVRTNNAVFVQRDQMAALSVPEYAFATDALIIYQGDTADFAYDGPVVWHEFGHGVIHSTSDWDYSVVVDSRSANAESQALNEGSADILAAMTGNLSRIGAYVGPRTDPGSLAIRELDNTAKCPDILQGESHQDSQHFTGAIWEARKTMFQGADQGGTFDAAFYAALVSFPKNVGFESAASIVSASVGQAFPSIPDAQLKMKAIFDARGVTNCSKVLDVTNAPSARPYYAIPGTSSALLSTDSIVPGPYQFKIHVPNGAKSVTMTGPYFGGGGGGMATVRVRVLAKADAPITFTKNGNALTNDADVTNTPTAANGMMTGRAEIAVKCGGDLYFTLANTSQRDRTMFDLGFSFEPADSCPPAEVPDAGQPEPLPVTLATPPTPLGESIPGCGCNAGAMPFALLALGALLRRQRRA